MRRLCLLPLAAVAALALPSAAQAGLHCAAKHGPSRFCQLKLRTKRAQTVSLGSQCYAKRIYANGSDASSDAHFVAPHTIRMLNDIWSHHNIYGPLDVYGYYLSGHRMRFENRSRFAVTVYFDKHCH
jgi:hypothetical protein